MAKQKSLVFNSAFNVIYQMIYVIFPFVTAIYVSNILLVEGVGKVAYAQNIASYFAAIAPLGVQNYGVKEIAKTKDDAEKRNKCFSELFFINAISTLIVSTVYYMTILRIDFFSKEKLLYIVCGFPIILNLINVDWFYQGVEEYAYITVRSLVIKIASMILLFLTVRTKTDYVQYALITSFVGSANSLFNIIHLRRFVKLRWKGIQLKKHMKSELILACNILLSNIYSKVDITMLGYQNSDAVTGYYANAFKIVNIVLCICNAMTDVLLPRLSYAFYAEKKKYSVLLNQGIEVILAIIFPAAIGISLLSPMMIPILFGPTFAPASFTVMMLAPLIVIKGFGNLACYQVAISSGNEKKQTVAYIFGCVVNVILNALLIPVLKQNGAAIASVVSEFTLNAILFFQLRKLSGVHIRWKYLLSVLTSSLIMGIAVKGVLWSMPDGLLTVCLAVLAGILLYAVTGYLMGNKLVRMITVKGKELLHKGRTKKIKE